MAYDFFLGKRVREPSFFVLTHKDTSFRQVSPENMFFYLYIQSVDSCADLKLLFFMVRLFLVGRSVTHLY